MTTPTREQVYDILDTIRRAENSLPVYPPALLTTRRAAFVARIDEAAPAVTGTASTFDECEGQSLSASHSRRIIAQKEL